MSNLVYVHIGKNIPNYIYHSLYQTLLINGHGCKIYVILDDCNIEEFWEKIDNYNFSVYFKETLYYKNVINTVPLSLLQKNLVDDDLYKKYSEKMERNFTGIENFREGFWISTTSRFFYIRELMNLYSINGLFHIENDIIMYESFKNIYSSVTKLLESGTKLVESENRGSMDSELYNILDKECLHRESDKIWVVRDAPNRVVPSLLYFPNCETTNELVDEMVTNILDTPLFINDMDNIGKYSNTIDLPIFPCVKDFDNNLMFDGAAIGQYMGGVDIRNVQCREEEKEILEFVGVKIGFVNETSVFKPDSCIFSKRNIKTNEHNIPLKAVICVDSDKKKMSNVANVHIHSKQLYKFSSVFDIKYSDLITGDKVLSLCDFVLMTNDIYNFHRGADAFAKDIIILKDWNNIDVDKLNNIFREYTKNNKCDTVKLFIYTHILEPFCKTVLEKLDTNINYEIYMHNSDHPLDNSYKELLEKDYIKHVYAQNIDYSYKTNKLTLLPIGMANSMWVHGDTMEMYRTMIDTYMNRKTKSIYVNINPNTYGYRKNILDVIQKTGCWELSQSKPYREYLRELSQYRFCLCIRGNGLDTHRFWESLYLGVIPVILDNNYTRCSTFIKYLRKLDIPFVVIEEDDIEKMCEKYSSDYFSENKYNELIKKNGSSIYNIDSLKLEYYRNIE